MVNGKMEMVPLYATILSWLVIRRLHYKIYPRMFPVNSFVLSNVHGPANRCNYSRVAVHVYLFLVKGDFRFPSTGRVFHERGRNARFKLLPYLIAPNPANP
ncbi:hypothetical protein M378DRAFT_155027 [Amanita muscaria Koide BX008]|uniref:Uncharacterized protein n=1 Tax=Amanita muscaria (strain Koide BX008) TaxID=946122 RepID=A0A0C2XQI2_AMAMK|nr:hypothetical protein M378DRAFT_155027 [Amanita muscaria Koide BX008]